MHILFPCLPHAALIAYSLASQALLVQEDLAALPAGHAIAIRGYAVEQWAAPAVLAPLTTLTELRLFRQAQLSGSQLEQILQRLAQLRHLIICDCQLAAIPAALSCCTQLASLSLDGSRLAAGWQHLQPLAQLQHLVLSGTDHLPASLGQLTQLQHLVLSGTAHLPASLGQLTQLQHLVLRGAADLPASLGQLTQLTHLELERCSNVPAVSHQLSALHRLQSLQLSECGLAEVPAAVSGLTALTALCLQHNRLAGGFDHLRPLVQLRQLHLQANDLDEVPAAISALTALQHLSLGYPAGGWQHLRPLAQLRSFDALRCWDNAPDTRLLLASEAAANLHPAAVQRVLDESGGDLPELLDLLAQRSLPHPI